MPAPPDPARRVALAAHALFFASGALGLVYEVLWMRRFTVLFGATSLAATATVTAFFLGLAAGSAVLGRRAARWRRPLLAFGLLEAGVGLGATLVPSILGLYERIYPMLQPALVTAPLAFAVLKMLLAAAALLLPTACMGGSLPVLGELVAPGRTHLGTRVGRLYAVNIAGATMGALSVPYVLLPRLGADFSYGCAIAGSLALGAAACLAGRGAVRPPSASTETPARDTDTPRASLPGRVAALSGLSGALSLALQVLWTRTFALVHENSVYSFAAVLAVFLSGLSAGAALADRRLRQGVAPMRLLGISWTIAGAAILASPLLFYALTGGLRYIDAEDRLLAVARLLSLALVTVLPATLLMGVALPALMEAAGARSAAPAGPVIGRLLAVNTVGAIVGPLLATFVVAPALGLWWSLLALGCVTAATGVWVGIPRRLVPAAAVALLITALTLAPAQLPPVRLGPGERLVSVRDGTYGTTAVLADDRDRWIAVNNSYILGGTAGATEERWQAHLPLLLHPAPRRVAFLGLGTGITAGAALLHPVESVVGLEIVPEVVTAARDDFADANAGLLGDRRVTVVVDDGRNYLAGQAHSFDVIVGDLLVPWRPSEAPLYSLEHYAAVRHALKEGGLFCQWLPLYQLDDEQLAIIVRTFADVFPRSTLWRGSFIAREPTVAMIGHVDERPLNPVEVDHRVRRLAALEDNPFLSDPAGLWLFLVGPLQPRAAWLSEQRRNRDGSPWVEMLGPFRSKAPARGWPGLLSAVATTPLDGTPLAQLDAVHRGWKETGARLAQATEAAGPQGQHALVRTLRTLPEALQVSLDVNQH